MSPKPSTLLLHMRAAFAASKLSNRAIAKLTKGGASYAVVNAIKNDDGVLPIQGTVLALARALSHNAACVEHWKRTLHPVGEDCVAYWTSLHAQASTSSRRITYRKASSPPSSQPLALPHECQEWWKPLIHVTSHPVSAYCEL